MLIRFAALLLLLCVFLPNPSYAQNKRALLVGVNDYMYIGDLNGPRNDVRIIKETLMNRYGFQPHEIKVLLDRQATKNNIMRTFENWLIKGTQKGDLTVFYFSGHGSQVPDFNNDEDDGQDEVLCPADTDPPGASSLQELNLIIDDELGVMFRELEGREVVVIIDACNSGSVSRTIRGKGVGKIEQTAGFRAKYYPLSFDITGASKNPRSSNIFKQDDIPDGQIYITASEDYQLAIETIIGGIFNGILTMSLVDVMSTRSDLTYRELFEASKKVLKDDYNGAQDPQLTPKRGSILDKIAFSRPSTPQETVPYNPPQVDQMTEKKVLLKIDNISGITGEFKRELGKLPYVKIVSGDLFDRVIRGEVKGGVINLRLINHIGDVTDIAPSSSMNKVVAEIAPHLEYAYLVKQLAHLDNPNPSFRVKLTIDGDKDVTREFRVGDKIVYNVECDVNCHLLILNLDPRGNINVLFPNKYHSGTFVRGGQNVQIPNAEMRKKQFELQFFPPTGEEMVKVIATTKPLSLGQLGIDNFEGLFKSFKGSALSGSSQSRRMLNDVVDVLDKQEKEEGFQWSEDTIILRSHQ